MEFIAPIPFREAIDKLGSQQVMGSTFTSAEWRDVPLELRDNAFFSSRIESAQFLQRAQDALGDFIAGNRQTLDDGQTMLKTGSRAAFVQLMQDFLTRNGVTRSSGGLQDITSEARLGLIFDIKTRQARPLCRADRRYASCGQRRQHRGDGRQPVNCQPEAARDLPLVDIGAGNLPFGCNSIVSNFWSFRSGIFYPRPTWFEPR